MPETVMFSLVAWPTIGLMMLGAVQRLVVILFFGIIATAFFLAPYVMYLVTIWYPTLWFQDRWGTTSASIYVLAWITFFFITFRSFKEFSFSSASGISSFGVQFSASLQDYFSAWAVARLLARIAHNLAIHLGGNYFGGRA
jgi:hypothetical protein